jgi:hypothetical protein
MLKVLAKGDLPVNLTPEKSSSKNGLYSDRAYYGFHLTVCKNKTPDFDSLFSDHITNHFPVF